MPCISFGDRTAGGCKRIGDDVAHRLAVAEGVMWFSKLGCGQRSRLEAHRRFCTM
jgi:hypothetical protein